MILDIAIGLAAGAVAGIVFFGGLRWTVTRLATSRRPVALAAGSFALRSVLVVIVIVGFASTSAASVLAALVGMLAVRTAVVAGARRIDAAGGEETSWT